MWQVSEGQKAAEKMMDSIGTAESVAVTMTFGRHKGQSLEAVPSSYLEWALDKAESVDDEMRAAMKAELKARSEPPGTTLLPGLDAVPF